MGNRTSVQVNFGARTSAQFSSTSAQVINFDLILLHGAEVNISIELGAEVNISCRSSQHGAEVTRGEHRLPHVKDLYHLRQAAVRRAVRALQKSFQG